MRADRAGCACSEIEEKTQRERQERQNAASAKESEMKEAAAAALAQFHADRKKAAEDKLAENLCVLGLSAPASANATVSVVWLIQKTSRAADCAERQKRRRRRHWPARRTRGIQCTV